MGAANRAAAQEVPHSQAEAAAEVGAQKDHMEVGGHMGWAELGDCMGCTVVAGRMD